MQGRSRDLGIAFEVAGGAKWCAPSVVVKLDAPQRSVFDLDNPAFVLMVGRIKSIIVDQCSSAELITFEGQSERQPAFGMEISRLTKWKRLTRLDPATRKPICDGGEARGPDCDKRIAAYATAKQTMRGPSFADTEIVKLLDTSAGEHVVWNTNRVVGKLQLAHRAELGGAFADAGSLADAIIAQTGAACAANGDRAGAPSASAHEKGLAYRALACQSTGGRVAHNVVLVTAENDWFYIFSLWSDDADKSKVSEAAGRLAKAIAAVGRR